MSCYPNGGLKLGIYNRISKFTVNANKWTVSKSQALFFFFLSSLSMFVSGLRTQDEFISCYGSRRGKIKPNSPAVSEHDYLKNSWNCEDEVPEGELRAAGEGSCMTQLKGISQTCEPLMEALLYFSLTLPLVSPFTSHVYFQGPQARKIRKRQNFMKLPFLW